MHIAAGRSVRPIGSLIGLNAAVRRVTLNLSANAATHVDTDGVLRLAEMMCAPNLWELDVDLGGCAWPLSRLIRTMSEKQVHRRRPLQRLTLRFTESPPINDGLLHALSTLARGGVRRLALHMDVHRIACVRPLRMFLADMLRPRPGGPDVFCWTVDTLRLSDGSSLLNVAEDVVREAGVWIAHRIATVGC